VSTQGDLKIDVEDTAKVLLEYENGTIGSVHLDYLQQPPTHWLEIIGTQGTVHWDYYEGTTRVFTNEGGEWERYSLPPDFVRNDMFVEEMRGFLATIQGDAKPSTSLDDGVSNLQIALAALESGERNAPINLDSIY
jgi:predicted dehydrogenase